MCIDFINDFYMEDQLDISKSPHLDYLQQIIVCESEDSDEESPLCYIPNNNEFKRIPQPRIVEV